MKRFSCVLSLLFVTACAGGSGSSVPQTVPAAQPLGITGLTEAQSGALSGLHTASVPVSNDMLYVGNQTSILVFRHDASGNSAPVRVISGPSTEITNAGQLSQDANGNLYVANPPAAVLVFAPNANGNVKPIRVLRGPATGMHSIGAVSVDPTTGKLFVVDNTGPDGTYANLLRFPPNANGNVAPFANGKIFLWSYQTTFDSSGQNLIESGFPSCCSDGNAGIDTWTKQYANGSSLNPVRIVYAMYSSGIVDDPTSRTYLFTNGFGIWRLAETTTGNGGYPYLPLAPMLTPKAVSIITSDTCGGQLALGYLRNIYVVHNAGVCGSGSTDAIYVYAHDASGNAKPIRILTGPATLLHSPNGIYEGK